MDWKYEAADKLKCYEARNSSCARAQRELHRLEAEMLRIRSATADGTPVCGSGGNAREDALVNNITRREELKVAIRTTHEWVEIVNSGLSVLTDEERHILDRFYIHRARGNVEKLCSEMHLEKSRVYELKDKALRHFTLALYGVVET